MKVYIKAFSLARGEAIQKLGRVSSTLNEHLIKCIIFGEHRPDSYQHWLHEVVSFITTCDKGNISGANLKDKDYKNSLFGSFGDSISDAEDNLKQFEVINIHSYKNTDPEIALPYFIVNDEMVSCLYNCYQDLIITCIPLLKDKNVHPISYWKRIIQPIVDDYKYLLKPEDIVEHFSEVNI